MRQIEYISSLPPDEQARIKLFMTIHTRDTLFGHMDEEGQALKAMDLKVSQMHAAIYGTPGDEEDEGALKALKGFTKTMERINTWLDGACWILKTALPWAVGTTTAIIALGKYLGWL